MRLIAGVAPFFLHGHRLYFYDKELNQIERHINSNFSSTIKRPVQDKILNVGSTHHFTRSMVEYYGRNEAWSTLGRNNRAFRDKNHVEYDGLVKWSERMRDEGWVKSV
mmetsp:Transcript_24493/g.67822  ORF Transcript_24493/g.67822 Transcript_24493/m.67822 type:complete len:108 (-) Transcript_24493:203-526(-)